MARPMSLIGRPGLDGLDAVPHALLGDPHQLAADRVDVADEERGVGVAVDAADVGGDVEVEDVAVLQHPGVGDAVADDLVGRRAHALREAVVVERRRVGVALDVQLVDVRVDLVGGDARAHELAGQAQDLGGDGAGAPHPGDDLGRLDCAARPTAPGARSRRTAGGRCRSGTARIGLTTPGQHAALGALVAALVLAPAPAPAGVVGLRQRGGGVGQRAHRSQDTACLAGGRVVRGPGAVADLS